MSDKKFDEEMPQIYLDKDDRDTFRRDFKPGANKPYTPEPEVKVETTNMAAAKPGVKGIWLWLVFFLAAGGYGASWWLYEQGIQQFQVMQNSQQRIADLEQQLSATGAEMGESAVAMQVKVTKLSERTQELWEQMDKLWASAWRRNQADIKSVQQNLGRTDKSVKELQQGLGQFTTVNQQIKTNETHLVDLEGRLKQQVGDNRQLKESLLMVQANDIQSETQMAALTELLNKAERQNTELSKRLQVLEEQMKKKTATTTTPKVNLVNNQG